MQDLEIMFTRYLHGTCTAVEAQAIEQMLRDQPDQQLAFARDQTFHQDLGQAFYNNRQVYIVEQIQEIARGLAATTPVPHSHIRTSILGFWLLCSGMIFTTVWIQFNNSSESITTLLFMTCGLVFTAALAWYLARPQRRLSVMGALESRINLSQWQHHGLRDQCVSFDGSKRLDMGLTL